MRVGLTVILGWNIKTGTNYIKTINSEHYYNNNKLSSFFFFFKKGRYAV